MIGDSVLFFWSAPQFFISFNSVKLQTQNEFNGSNFILSKITTSAENIVDSDENMTMKTNYGKGKRQPRDGEKKKKQKKKQQKQKPETRNSSTIEF